MKFLRGYHVSCLACTKGTNAKSMRKQPFSDIPAKQRAYSLKNSYMTAYIRRILMNEDVISVFKPEELKSKSVDELLHERFATLHWVHII